MESKVNLQQEKLAYIEVLHSSGESFFETPITYKGARESDKLYRAVSTKYSEYLRRLSPKRAKNSLSIMWEKSKTSHIISFKVFEGKELIHYGIIQ